MTQKTKNPDGLRRRTFLQLAGASAVAGTLARPAVAQGQTTVRWWYHYDNPQNTPAALVAKFEAANPGIKVQAEAIPWGGGTDYINRISRPSWPATSRTAPWCACPTCRASPR